MYQIIYAAIAQDKGWQFIYPQRLTEELIKIPSASRFIVAEIDGTVIAGGLFLKDGDSVFYFHGAADRAYNHFFPSRAVMDAAIRWACEIGAEFFNFGSCGQNMSLALFKSFWGTHMENNLIFRWSNPIWDRVGKAKARTLGRVKTRTKSLLFKSNLRNLASIDANSWSARAQLEELEAVLVVNGSERRRLMMHAAGLVAAEKALSLTHERRIRKPLILDFGCGTGRMVRFFGKHGCDVVGLDVTLEMLQAAKRYDLPSGAFLSHFDGLSIPFKDHSFDMVWVCGVLKYTLFPPHTKCCRHGNMIAGTDNFVPSYNEIAREMHRVLKPGGIVAQNEMWVDQPPQKFAKGFEGAGFVSEHVSVMRKYGGRAEGICEFRENFRLPPDIVLLMGRICATLRLIFDNPYAKDDSLFQQNDNPYVQKNDFRDYLLLWRKPII
jgi:SAM-dependent methyltransferase